MTTEMQATGLTSVVRWQHRGGSGGGVLIGDSSIYWCGANQNLSSLIKERETRFRDNCFRKGRGFGMLNVTTTLPSNTWFCQTETFIPEKKFILIISTYYMVSFSSLLIFTFLFTLKQMNAYIWSYACHVSSRLPLNMFKLKRTTFPNTYVKMFRHFWNREEAKWYNFILDHDTTISCGAIWHRIYFNSTRFMSSTIFLEIIEALAYLNMIGACS